MSHDLIIHKPRETIMKVIGRKAEIKELGYYAETKKSELVCVYGRRRVGKTFLVEQTFGEYFAFRATGLENGKTRDQLKAFNARLIKHGCKNKTIPINWFEAFSRLEEVLYGAETTVSPTGKKIVFFDELPWFDTARSDFMLAFEEFWNRCGTQHGDLLFIICGSATSWIIDNVINDTGSLYHRTTAQIFVKPFTLHETEQFFKDREFDWSREQITEFQMVFGGLPYFMDLLNINESFRQNIDRLMFRQGALLRNEASRLLEATLRKSPIYSDILELLSKHRYGLKRTECQGTLNVSGSSFTRALDNLIKCGYVIEYTRNYEHRKPLYIQLIDPFLLFHFHFLSKGEKQLTSYDDLSSDIGRYNDWRGTAFEMLCLIHAGQIKKALGIAGVKTDVFPWNCTEKNKKAQIDIVIERADNITNLCELKYTDEPYKMTDEADQALIKKRDMFKEMTETKQSLRIVLISAHGLSGTAHTEHISEVITLDDLFEG